MRLYKDFIKEIRAPGKEECPVGMRFDKKLKICVPIVSKSKYGGRWWGVGHYHHRTTNGNGNGNGHGNGNGSYNGNGGGNGNGGNGSGGGGNGGGGNGGG